MKDCALCVFRTTILVKKFVVSHNSLLRTHVTNECEAQISACGNAPGNPVEIPQDRIACAQHKGRKQT